jgi:hypothetical protein
MEHELRKVGTRGMVRENKIREGEVAIDLPQAKDAGLVFIGRIARPGPRG